MAPSVTFSDHNAGGLGGVGGGLLGNSTIGVVAGGVQMKDASTVLTLIDNRSSVQLAAAEGSARNFDLGGFGGGIGSVLGHGAGAGLGGYTSTAQGKVIVAAFVDSYSNVVRAVQSYKAQEVKGGLGKGGQLKVGDQPDADCNRRRAGLISGVRSPPWGGSPMTSIQQRVINILTKPKDEWSAIAAEPSDIGGLRQYIVPLSAIPAVCSLLGITLIGLTVPLAGRVRVGFLASLGHSIVSYLLGLAVVFVAALVIERLAPAFQSRGDTAQALKLVAYSSTPISIAGVLTLIPVLAPLEKESRIIQRR